MPVSPPAPLPGPRDVPVAQPTDAQVIPITGAYAPAAGMALLNSGLGARQDVEAELDGIAHAVRAFASKQPDQIMRECAAYSARLTELCVLLHRVEGLDRQYLRLRTQQVEKYLAELDRQFKIASRLVEVMRQDLELMK